MPDGRLGGVQPAARLLRRRVAECARWLEVDYSVLRANLLGQSVARAEVKLGVADFLGRPLEEVWTPQMLDTIHRGPRGGGPR